MIKPNYTSVCHRNNMASLKSYYGLAEADFQELMNQQNGCCAICGVDFGSLEKRANVDHCHTTGIVRGLLCGPCNMKLGVLETIEFSKFIKYLEAHKTKVSMALVQQFLTYRTKHA